MKPRQIVVTTGSVGWGNRKGGVEAYGPGGRWAGPIELPNRSNANVVYGDLLGDHLEELGVHEGCQFIVVAFDSRYTGDEAVLLRAAIQRCVDEYEADVLEAT